MTKIIKEIIIMLLICLISMLILAVVLYDYVPNRKVVAEVSTYATSQEVEAQLADDIDSEEKEVVLTYEVTSKDLTSYEIANEYVPGKSNPFAAAAQSVEGETEGNTTGAEDGSTENIIDIKPSEEDKKENTSFTTEDEGIK